VSESAWGPLCITANLLADWPLRVNSVGSDRADHEPMSALPPKADKSASRASLHHGRA
jgi:hypothetical protein